MEVKCYIIDHVEWTCIEPKEDKYVCNPLSKLTSLFILFFADHNL